jgi:hypothetical protein
MNGYLFVALATVIATACSGGEQGVTQAQTGDPVIVLSEGACLGTCPIYDMTLHPGGEYVLNGDRFVKTTGVSEGDLGKPTWTKAVGILEDAGFWTLKPMQTASTMPNCHTDAPTAKVTWRTEEGKEKTVVYNAGCGVDKMQELIRSLRGALHFQDLVWTDEKFDPSGAR